MFFKRIAMAMSKLALATVKIMANILVTNRIW